MRVTQNKKMKGVKRMMTCTRKLIFEIKLKLK